MYFFFCSLFVFIQRFHKVAVLHQSITKIRAGAHGEGKCEFSVWEELPLVLRQATRLFFFFKRCAQTAFLTLPHQRKEKRKKTHKINLTKERKKIDIKKIKMFFHAHIFCIAQPTYSKALFPFVTGVHGNLLSATVLCDHQRDPFRMVK